MTESRTFALLDLTIKAKVWDRMPMVLHEEIATGEHEKYGKFRMIRDISVGTIYVDLAGQCYELSMRDIMNALIDQKEAGNDK